MPTQARAVVIGGGVGGAAIAYHLTVLGWTDGVLGAAWLPTDGWLDPSGLTRALAAGARKRGATILPHTRVTGISLAGGRVTGVETERGTIDTEVVVNAAGMATPEVGSMVGV